MTKNTNKSINLACIIVILTLFQVQPVLAVDKVDSDKDGLSDDLELLFHSDPLNPDSDGDGFTDGLEVQKGYSPTSTVKIKLTKKIEINTAKQELSYYLSDVKLGTFPVSTGKKSTPTPKGIFFVKNKAPRAWSKPYGLWMPYWLGMDRGRFGIHELPEWPGGKKEGANHLGTPVSHGCIRLGVGAAKIIYNWAEIGTTVIIK